MGGDTGIMKLKEGPKVTVVIETKDRAGRIEVIVFFCVLKIFMGGAVPFIWF